MLTDTHAHLDYPEFADDFAGVLQRAEEAGVRRIITIATSLASSRRAVELAERHPQVWATVGIHPGNAGEHLLDDVAALRELAQRPRVVAIGEIGFDFYRPDDAATRPAQEVLFRAQMELAAELKKNVVIHQRAAWPETLEALRAMRGAFRAVYHCFTEPWERAEEVLALGHLVSFTGIITFKNAQAAQETVRRVPEGRFMVETDAPYLAPVPHRGKPCEPAHTRLVAEQAARLRGVELAVLAAETEATANRFFWKEAT